MNQKLERWFSNGQISEALSGRGKYFLPDVTYRNKHNSLLAVGELLTWAMPGREALSAQGFEKAVTETTRYDLEDALLLMRAYSIVSVSKKVYLPISMEDIAASITHAVEQDDKWLEDQNHLHLLMEVIEDYPQLRQLLPRA